MTVKALEPRPAVPLTRILLHEIAAHVACAASAPLWIKAGKGLTCLFKSFMAPKPSSVSQISWSSFEQDICQARWAQQRQISSSDLLQPTGEQASLPSLLNTMPHPEHCPVMQSRADPVPWDEFQSPHVCLHPVPIILFLLPSSPAPPLHTLPLTVSLYEQLSFAPILSTVTRKL